MKTALSLHLMEYKMIFVIIIFVSSAHKPLHRNETSGEWKTYSPASYNCSWCQGMRAYSTRAC